MSWEILFFYFEDIDDVQRASGPLGMRLFWEINIKKKTPHLRSTMTENYFFLPPLPSSCVVLCDIYYFYFEGYKSTRVWKNKPRPHSTISTFKHSFVTFLLLLTFCGCACCFLITGYQLVSEISDSLSGAISRSSLTVIYCDGGKLHLFLRVKTHLLIKE